MKGREQRFNIGGASVVLIFIVCAMSVSAVLSLRASYHEYKLASKSREAVKNYYIADGKAEEIYAQIHELTQNYIRGDIDIKADEFYQRLNGIPNVTMVSKSDDILNYQVEIDESSVLKVELRLNIQATENTRGKIDVESWKLVHVAQGIYEDAVYELWDGIIEE